MRRLVFISIMFIPVYAVDLIVLGKGHAPIYVSNTTSTRFDFDNDGTTDYYVKIGASVTFVKKIVARLPFLLMGCTINAKDGRPQAKNSLLSPTMLSRGRAIRPVRAISLTLKGARAMSRVLIRLSLPENSKVAV